ncbi:hypothetical protein GALMADRAFT_136636 [Galerina marginata CBS 339.88]|uniref:GPI transamidase component PIG-S n=1 Tax=Galerina marginata (strain CBS 339.88) TaxID=685588 RepID=A0A067TMA0_GALM3|nr:hypothetical protein GALMADRAFT_136636 [Galerina marginata CBS 339.88]
MDPSPPANDVDGETEASRLPSSLRDPKKLFYQNDGLRRSIIFAYWVVFILALPVWWYTTSIERLSLPSSRVRQLAQNHLELPIRVCVDTPDVLFIESVRTELARRESKDPQRWRGVALDVLDKADCSTWIIFLVHFFVVILSPEETTEHDVYTVSSKAGQATIQERRLYLPLTEPDSSTELVDTLSALLVPYSSFSDPEHRVAQYSPRYRLAFSLLNEDAAAGGGVKDWRIQEELKSHISPILRRLAVLHNFTIESQVQFHAPLAFSPLQLEDRQYGIAPADLTVFINSAEWTLSSSSSNDPVLHFVLFIPSASRRPLRILANDGTLSPSSAFLLPQWGGIVIHNPISDSPQNPELPSQDLHAIFSLFANQLLSLLGVPTLPADVTSLTQTPHVDATVLSDCQLDALVRRRTLENSQGSQDTLLSIIKLVDQIENMPVGQDVRGDIENALDALVKMYESSTTSLQQTFSHSAESLHLASRAFFSPGMLALLYFPAEHKYAVYTPLFASAVIPLFVAALRELLAYRRERKLAKKSQGVAEPH